MVLQTRTRRPKTAQWWKPNYNLTHLLAKTRRIKYATVIPTEELAAALPSYSLTWMSPPYENFIVYYYFRRKT